MAVISMIAALAVVIMLVATFLEIADLASAMVASFLVWFIGVEFGLSNAFSCYAVTGVLSFLLLPSKLPAFYFVLLYGWYPPTKLMLHKKISTHWIRFIIKAFITVIAVILEEVLARNLLGYVQTHLMTAIIVLLSLFIYIPYDILLSKLAIVYIKKWRKHIFRQ